MSSEKKHVLLVSTGFGGNFPLEAFGIKEKLTAIMPSHTIFQFVGATREVPHAIVVNVDGTVVYSRSRNDMPDVKSLSTSAVEDEIVQNVQQQLNK